MPKVQWVIPCPVCGKRLRLLDQSYLGRRGQCPVCRHKFMLEVPKAPGYMAKKKRSELDPDTADTGETMKFDYDVELASGQPESTPDPPG